MEHQLINNNKVAAQANANNVSARAKSYREAIAGKKIINGSASESIQRETSDDELKENVETAETAKDIVESLTEPTPYKLAKMVFNIASGPGDYSANNKYQRQYEEDMINQAKHEKELEGIPEGGYTPTGFDKNQDLMPSEYFEPNRPATETETSPDTYPGYGVLLEKPDEDLPY